MYSFHSHPSVETLSEYAEKLKNEAPIHTLGHNLFLGHVPENMTEEYVSWLFENLLGITNVRFLAIPNKNNCGRLYFKSAEDLEVALTFNRKIYLLQNDIANEYGILIADDIPSCDVPYYNLKVHVFPPEMLEHVSNPFIIEIAIPKLSKTAKRGMFPPMQVPQTMMMSSPHLMEPQMMMSSSPQTMVPQMRMMAQQMMMMADVIEQQRIMMQQMMMTPLAMEQQHMMMQMMTPQEMGHQHMMMQMMTPQEMGHQHMMMTPQAMEHYVHPQPMLNMAPRSSTPGSFTPISQGDFNFDSESDDGTPSGLKRKFS